MYSLVLFLAIGSPPALDVTSDEWRHNDTGIQCAYAAAECLARHHHLEGGYGLTHLYFSGCPSASYLESVLNNRGIKTKRQDAGNRSREILREAVANKWGAVVGLQGCHCVALVGFDEKDGTVQIVDNMTTFGVREWSMDTFLSRWDGFVVVLLPDKDSKECKAEGCWHKCNKAGYYWLEQKGKSVGVYVDKEKQYYPLIDTTPGDEKYGPAEKAPVALPKAA